MSEIEKKMLITLINADRPLMIHEITKEVKSRNNFFTILLKFEKLGFLIYEEPTKSVTRYGYYGIRKGSDAEDIIRGIK